MNFVVSYGVRGALAADDALSDLGARKFRVRQTPGLKVYAASLEAEMLKRRMFFGRPGR